MCSQLGFTSDKLDPMALRDLVQWTVRPRLLAPPGVARVAALWRPDPPDRGARPAG